MAYIADPRNEEEIRSASFETRLLPWRKGYGTESLNAIIRFAFDSLGYRKLTATVTAGNIASKRLLLKSGFRQKGVIRQSYYLNGEWRDDWVFGLLADDYHG